MAVLGLMIVIVIQLQLIYLKLPKQAPRDYVAEAMERDRLAKEMK